MNSVSPGDILWPHLSELPAFRALIRSIEARLLSEQGEPARPLLDIGCGDGHFAQTTLGRAEMGIDVDVPSLRQAQKRGVYAGLGVASAARLPFAGGVFATALANCAIEHMPELDAVLGEVRRVLRPGGRFIFSVPTDRLNDNLLVAGVLERAGLAGAAARYRAWFQRMQVHYHMYSPDEWQHRAEAAGFQIVFRREYLSARATHLLELGHYYGVPNVISRRLLGRWVVWPWRPRFVLEENVLGPRVVEDGLPGSSCCFFVAVKV